MSVGVFINEPIVDLATDVESSSEHRECLSSKSKADPVVPETLHGDDATCGLSDLNKYKKSGVGCARIKHTLKQKTPLRDYSYYIVVHSVVELSDGATGSKLDIL